MQAGSTTLVDLLFFSLPNHTLIDVASTLFTMIRPRKRLEGPRKLGMIRVGQLVPTLRRIAQEFKPTQNQNVEVSKQKQRPWCPNQKTSILGCNNRQTSSSHLFQLLSILLVRRTVPSICCRALLPWLVFHSSILGMRTRNVVLSL
jgi:hypothetical protein